MKKNNSLQYKIIVLSLILCVFVMSGCNKKEDKTINDFDLDSFFDDYDEEYTDDLENSNTDESTDSKAASTRVYKTMKDAKVIAGADEKVLFGTYRIERKLNDAWSYIQKNLTYKDVDTASINKFVEKEPGTKKLSVEPIEVQFGYLDTADLKNASSESALTLSSNESDSNYKLMCALYAESGQEYSRANNKTVLSGEYIYYVYELDNDYILYTPLEINKATLNVNLPAKSSWNKMKYGFAGNSLILDVDGHEVDLASYGSLMRDKGEFDLRGYSNDPDGYNNVVGIRLSDFGNGSKQCTITFMDGSSTWEMYGATFDISGDNDITISWKGNDHPEESELYKMSEQPGEIKGKLLYACSPYTGENYFSIVTDSGIYYFLSDSFDNYDKPVEVSQPEETVVDDNPDDNDKEDTTEDTTEEIDEIQKEIVDELTEGFEEIDVEVNIDENTGKTILDESILFGYNSAKLTNEGKEYLDKFLKVYADLVTGENFEGKISAIKIEGHTDTIGTYEYNLDLSKKRAENVAKYCKEVYPELASLIETEGKSYTEPIYNEDGTVNNKASRRVEFKIILNY